MAVSSEPRKRKSNKLVETVVPWDDPKQFCEVYELLYQPDICAKRLAVEIMAVWESRCFPSLPTAVEASLVITKAIIQDILFENGRTISQAKDIQMLYCMALVRFVNLTVEIHQTHNKLSYAVMAQNLGIPSWIIDLRNEATHSFTPSLPVLRMGAETAMKYLEKTYWKKEAKRVFSIVNEPADTETIKILLLDYQKLQHELEQCRNKKLEQYKKNIVLIHRTLKAISICLARFRKEVIEILVQDGFFILPESVLKFLLTKQDFMNFCDTAVGNHSKEDISIPEIPESLMAFWLPLLLVLNRRGAIHDLVEKLLYSQADRDEMEQRQLAAWVFKILNFACNPYPANRFFKRIFKNSMPSFDWEQILFAALKRPSPYTPRFLPLITEHLDLEEDFERHLMNLLAIFLGKTIDPKFKLPKNHVVFTVEKLKQDKRLQEMKIKQKKKKDDNIWSEVPDDINLENIPIGYTFKPSPDNAVDESDIISQMNFDTETTSPQKFLFRTYYEDMEDETVIVEDDIADEEEVIQNLEEEETFLYSNFY